MDFLLGNETKIKNLDLVIGNQETLLQVGDKVTLAIYKNGKYFYKITMSRNSEPLLFKVKDEDSNKLKTNCLLVEQPLEENYKQETEGLLDEFFKKLFPYCLVGHVEQYHPTSIDGHVVVLDPQ